MTARPVPVGVTWTTPDGTARDIELVMDDVTGRNVFRGFVDPLPGETFDRTMERANRIMEDFVLHVSDHARRVDDFMSGAEPVLPLDGMKFSGAIDMIRRMAHFGYAGPTFADLCRWETDGGVVLA